MSNCEDATLIFVEDLHTAMNLEKSEVGDRSISKDLNQLIIWKYQRKKISLKEKIKLI